MKDDKHTRDFWLKTETHELYKSVCNANNLNSIKIAVDKLAYALHCPAT